MSDVDSPALTVVVPSVNGWGELCGCLAALDGERRSLKVEVLVPERCGQQVQESIASTFPWVRVLPVPPGTTIPAMRATAFAVASGSTVAVIEDHVLVPAGWARQMCEARTEHRRVIGGGVVNAATGRIVDWAAFLCEYSQMVAPTQAGPASWLTGNNTAYDRRLFEEFRREVESGHWEDHLHDAFRRRGVVLWSRPDIVVRHDKHYTIREYAGQRFLSSRAYAAAQLGSAGSARRAAYVMRTLALPVVLLWRIMSRTWRGGQYRAELLRSLPLITVFVVAWGAGELVGAVFGGGDALGRVC